MYRENEQLKITIRVSFIKSLPSFHQSQHIKGISRHGFKTIFKNNSNTTIYAMHTAGYHIKSSL